MSSPLLGISREIRRIHTIRAQLSQAILWPKAGNFKIAVGNIGEAQIPIQFPKPVRSRVGDVLETCLALSQISGALLNAVFQFVMRRFQGIARRFPVGNQYGSHPYGEYCQTAIDQNDPPYAARRGEKITHDRQHGPDTGKNHDRAIARRPQPWQHQRDIWNTAGHAKG